MRKDSTFQLLAMVGPLILDFLRKHDLNFSTRNGLAVLNVKVPDYEAECNLKFKLPSKTTKRISD